MKNGKTPPANENGYDGMANARTKERKRRKTFEWTEKVPNGWMANFFLSLVVNFYVYACRNLFNNNHNDNNMAIKWK